MRIEHIQLHCHLTLDAITYFFPYCLRMASLPPSKSPCTLLSLLATPAELRCVVASTGW